MRRSPHGQLPHALLTWCSPRNWKLLSRALKGCVNADAVQAAVASASVHLFLAESPTDAALCELMGAPSAAMSAAWKGV